MAQPYTDRTIERLGKEGIKNMAIVTPAFVSDCLETLEEIAMEGEEIFPRLEDNFTYSCLYNDKWVDVLVQWINNWASIKAHFNSCPLSSKALGSQSIGSLLIKQALPASVGILVMSLNILVDTIFVGNWLVLQLLQRSILCCQSLFLLLH